MRNFSFISIFFLMLNLCAAAPDNSPKESLWNYASPTADVILYFDTKQPEQAMDKQLWNLIQRDKNKAIDSNSEGQLFDTKNRDMQGVVNLYIRSMTPFSATIEGVANITGDIQNDIQKLLCSLADEGAPAPQIIKHDELSKYNFKIPANDNLPPIDVMFTAINNNQLHFRINIIPHGDMSQEIIGTSQKKNKILNDIPQQDQAFVLAADIEKLSQFPILQTEKAKPVATYISQIKSVCIFGHVQNLHLLIQCNIVLKNVSSVSNYTQLLNSFRSKIAQSFKFEEMPKIISKDNVIRITGKINIKDAWQIISHITNRPKLKNSPAGK